MGKNKKRYRILIKVTEKLKEQSDRSLESGRTEVGEYCFVKFRKETEDIGES